MFLTCFPSCRINFVDIIGFKLSAVICFQTLKVVWHCCFLAYRVNVLHSRCMIWLNRHQLPSFVHTVYQTRVEKLTAVIQDHSSFSSFEWSAICCLIHGTYFGTYAYTPGRRGWAHLIPQLTIPPTNQWSPCFSSRQSSGPPESPCSIKWSINTLEN